MPLNSRPPTVCRDWKVFGLPGWASEEKTSNLLLYLEVPYVAWHVGGPLSFSFWPKRRGKKYQPWDSEWQKSEASPSPWQGSIDLQLSVDYYLTSSIHYSSCFLFPPYYLKFSWFSRAKSAVQYGEAEATAARKWNRRSMRGRRWREQKRRWRREGLPEREKRDS